METFPASSLADLEQIMAMTGIKLYPTDWFQGVNECPQTEYKMLCRCIFLGEGYSLMSHKKVKN